MAIDLPSKHVQKCELDTDEAWVLADSTQWLHHHCTISVQPLHDIVRSLYDIVQSLYDIARYL